MTTKLALITKKACLTCGVKCGCLCVRCCSKTDGHNCRTANSTSQCHPSNEECVRFDESTCSFHYSNDDQLYFCEIRDPVIWPAVLDTPEKENRPGRWSPDVVVFTSAEDPEVQEELTRRLLPEPDMSEFTTGMNRDVVQNGEVLSSTGVILGTPERYRLDNYIEPAFQGSGPLILSSNCARDYPGRDIELMNKGIYNVSALAIHPAPPSNNRRKRCTNVKFLHNTSTEIDRYLYCNFDEVRFSVCCLVAS